MNILLNFFKIVKKTLIIYIKKGFENKPKLRSIIVDWAIPPILLVGFYCFI